MKAAMYQTFRPLVDALKKRSADPRAVEDAAHAAQATGRSIRDILINDRVVTETELTEASAEAYGMNSIDLEGYPIDAAAMARIPLPLVLRHRVLGLAVEGDEIVAGITDPGDVVAIDDVRAATGRWWSRAASCAGSSTGCSARTTTSATWRPACVPSGRSRSRPWPRSARTPRSCAT